MPDYSMLTELLGLPNTQVVHYQYVGQQRLNLFVESTEAVAICPACGQVSTTVHEAGERQFIRDLPIWQRRCWLSYAPKRYECAQCRNTFVERVAWREPGAQCTQRYEQYVFERTRHESHLQIARSEGLTEEQVQGIFERAAKKN